MHTISLLEKGCQRNAVFHHQARLSAVLRVVTALLDGGRLSLTHAVPAEGRAITVYEEVHPLSRYNSPKTHRACLRTLHHIVPAHVTPIVVTDAGFRGPWFRQVEALSWHWIGRIRNTIKYFKPETGRWCYVNSLYPQATAKVRHIGERCLSKRHRYGCRLYLTRAYLLRTGRHAYRKSYGTNDALYRRLHRAAWWRQALLLPAPGRQAPA